MIHTVPARLTAALIVAPSWAVAAGLLVKGHTETGDGFSAGLTAGTGILIHYLVFGREETRHLGVVRHAHHLVWAGLLIALTTVFLPVALGSPPLTHIPGPASEPPSLGTLELQSALVFELGVFAIVLGFVLGALDLVAGYAERHDRDET